MKAESESKSMVINSFNKSLKIGTLLKSTLDVCHQNKICQTDDVSGVKSVDKTRSKNLLMATSLLVHCSSVEYFVDVSKPQITSVEMMAVDLSSLSYKASIK
ncbi:hypothetical protein WICPIJ_003849 [Wickerhamomyces pijperi]|uniref:Uncharacterized protein n=1 Tax=Wickerhamomyces pijperi TaxID=599730 RepID=A0A9P8TMN0_WICPI|nr:hypothetical protein WICPIJ_003849 [Wickerhamomyces pijperi]